MSGDLHEAGERYGLVYEMESIHELQRRKSQTLAVLLDELQDKKHHHLVVQVSMGEVESYLASVTLGWVAAKVGFANDLPPFKKADEDSVSAMTYSDLLELQQHRQPDWSRQCELATYLASRRHHKFPALLLVGYQGWVHQERSEKWDEDGRAMSDSLTLTSLDTTGLCWEIDDADTHFYALDGQHRLMAIRGLRELIQDGQLPARDKQGRAKSVGGLRRDDLLRRIGENTAGTHERLQWLMDERIGIEIVPAMRRGECYDEGLRRLRQMFVDVNEHAKG